MHVCLFIAHIHIYTHKFSHVNEMASSGTYSSIVFAVIACVLVDALPNLGSGGKNGFSGAERATGKPQPG